MKDKKPNVHIESDHKGEFTEWCKQQGYKKVTCGCIEKGLKSSDPKVRKQANFARNFPFKGKCKNL